jgi:LPXTG-motif cell wall-anchored protein
MGSAVADQWDKKTTITIDEPMQLPTTTLQPGTYVIRLLATSAADRHTVQFFDKDEKRIITTIEAIPNERVRPTGKSVFAFWETPAGQPKALRAWFYPGDNFGQEFAYPKDEAARISASNNNVTVPVNHEEKTTDVTAQNDTAVIPPTPVAEPAPAPVAAAEPAPVAEPVPAPAPVEVAAAQQPAPAPVDTSSDAQRVEAAPAPAALPQTASNMPLFALIGMLSMVAALALKFAYNRN